MIPRIKYVEIHQAHMSIFAEFKNPFEADTVNKTLMEVGTLTDEHYFYGPDEHGRRYPKYGHIGYRVDDDKIKEFRETIKRIAREEKIRVEES